MDDEFAFAPTRVGVGPRAVAAVIDILFVGVVLWIPLVVAFGHRTTYRSPDGTTTITWTGDGQLFLFGIAAALGYYIFLETLVGATVGKLLLNLRVRYEDGNPIGLFDAVVRNVVRFVDGFPYVIPYLVGAITIWGGSDRQRLGDRAAETIVTYK
jgi:uncharacterized RDD family membrane protein YckC